MVVPREPLEMQIIRKTAKFCTMMRAEPEHCDYGLKSVLLSFHLNSKYPLFCLYLFSLFFCARNLLIVVLLVPVQACERLGTLFK